MPGKEKKRPHTSRREKRRRAAQSRASKLKAANSWPDPDDPTRKITSEKMQEKTISRWKKIYEEQVLPLEGALLNETDSFWRTRHASNYRKALDDFLEKVRGEANLLNHKPLQDRVTWFQRSGEELLSLVES